MNLREIYNTPNTPIISFEFFPPKNDIDGSKTENLLKEISFLKKYSPAFVSLTHGASGYNSDLALSLIKNIKEVIGFNVMPHFTCICAKKTDVDSRLKMLETLGIENILALRGDIPTDRTLCANDFKFANELVSYIKSQSNFSIAVAGYPQGHCECVDLKTDIDNLKRKVDAGADAIITQLFFDNDRYWRYVERVRNVGINIPIIPGIMPVVNSRQIEKILSVMKVDIPSILRNNEDNIFELGVEFATKQCQELINSGVSGIHFYTLNKSDAVSKILDNIGKR